jgi:hypothetical protein
LFTQQLAEYETSQEVVGWSHNKPTMGMLLDYLKIKIDDSENMKLLVQL